MTKVFLAVRSFLVAPARVLDQLVLDLRSAPRRCSRRLALRRSISLMPEKPASLRSSEDWKRLRKRSLKDARQSLDANDTSAAIRLLSRALLEDPGHRPYLELLQQAAVQKRQRKGAQLRKTTESVADHSSELNHASNQLEGFVAYASALSGLLGKAGLKPHSPQLTRPKDVK